MKVNFTGKTIGRKDVRDMIRLLEQIRDNAKMITCSLNEMNCGKAPELITLNPYTDITAFVRERVAEHHGSWIIRPLNELIEQLSNPQYS